jgi:hypothetical protein
MEAQLQVMSLASNNSTLQAQLSGMRQQKQQLEEMLLFGSGEEWGGGCYTYTRSLTTRVALPTG